PNNRRTGAPHLPRAPDRSVRGRRTVEPRDRRAPVPLAPYCRRAPVSDLPQARDHWSSTLARRPDASHLTLARVIFRARRSLSGHDMSEKPNIVLVHGAWAD